VRNEIQIEGDAPTLATPQHKYKHFRTISIFTTRLLLLVLFIAGFFLTMFPWGRAVTRSTLLLPEVLAASQVAPFSWSSEPIKHTQMTAISRGGTIDLDVYTPVNFVPLITRVRSGILVISGVGDNRKEPQLVNLLESLAHTGVVVMNLTTPTLSNYTLSVNDADSAVQAFKVLASLPDMNGKSIGIISISAGVALASLAAADSRIRAQVSYVVAFGGYFNVKSLLRTIGQRQQDIDGKMVNWQPIPIPIEVLANTLGQELAPDERSILINALTPGGTALTAEEIVHLSTPAQAAYRILSGTAPHDVDANIAKLPPAIQTQLDQLSPSSVVGQIRAPIFLLHDRDDPSLPVTETRAFAATLTRLHHTHEYIEMHIFDHVRVRSDLSTAELLTDGWQLFNMLNDILSLNS
jgi:hypothetical protein